MASTIGERMPYYALQLDQLPKSSTEVVLARYGIRVMEVESASEASEEIQRVFLETNQTSRSTKSTTLASYTDLRPSRHYPKTRVGVMCSVQPCHNTEASPVSVLCHASADGRQIGGEAIVKSFDEARDMAFAFIEYAGNWIDPDWFNNAPLAAELSLEAKNSLSSVYESSSPERQRTRDLLNLWSTRITEKLDRQLPELNMRMLHPPDIAVSFESGTYSYQEISSPDNRSDNTVRASNALVHAYVGDKAGSVCSTKDTSRHPSELTSSEIVSIWKRLCRESRGLCRLRSKTYDCSSSDSELILRRIDSSREVKIILNEGWIIEDHGNVTEELRIVKLPRGGIVFEGTEKITSIPHLALKFIQDLAKVEDPTDLKAGTRALLHNTG
jgi:hypothetical protein